MSNVGQISEPGKDKFGADELALYLEMFSGEVLNTFDETNVMMPLHRVMRVGAGKTFQFPRIGKATAQYHTKGEDLLLDGNGYLNEIESTAIQINVDKPLIASTFVDNWDEMISHYPSRSEYAKQLGSALARTTDQQLLRLVAKAAREASPFSAQMNVDATKGAVIELDTSTETIRQGIIKAAIALTRNELDRMSDVTVLVSPEDYYRLLEDDQLVSADFSSAANADRADGKIFKAYGFRVVMTPRLAGNGLDVLVAGDTPEIGLGTHTKQTGLEYNDYSGNFEATRALAFRGDAIGTVMRDSVSTETDYRVERQGTLLVAKATMGHGILRQECAVEIVNATQ